MENTVLTSLTGMGACSTLILKVLQMLIQTHSDFTSMNQETVTVFRYVETRLDFTWPKSRRQYIKADVGV